MEKKNKTYNLRITEEELKNPKVKNALVKLMHDRIRFQKNKKYVTISEVEVLILRKAVYGWANVSLYAPKKKDQYAGEVGKFMGKRVVVRGRR